MEVLFPGRIGTDAGRQLADSDWWAILTFVYIQSIELAQRLSGQSRLATPARFSLLAARPHDKITRKITDNSREITKQSR
jgi:hypothetical protein